MSAWAGTRRLVREPLGLSLAPWAALALVAGDERPFALVGDWAGGGAVVGSEPVAVADPAGDPFAPFDALPPVPGAAEVEGFGGGWVGWLGFGARGGVEAAPPGPPRPSPLPPAALAFYDHVVRRDADGTWWWEALATLERAEALAARREALLERGRRLAGAAPPRLPVTAPWRSTPSPEGHAAAVAAARERIHQGDLFQANLCLRLDSTLLAGSVHELFAAGVRALAPARAAFVGTPDGDVASLSPELFLARRGRRVVSQPIKGTRRRPAHRAGAEAQRAALAGSAKDRVENVMIVDLVRNDLGRVCVPGSVEVVVDRAVRAHAGVWHLVSEVAGRLAPGVGSAELVRACFPPGSVTGAPKRAALAAIAELESTRREAYTGAIGFASPVAGLELNVAIRTVEHVAGRLWMGVGGGVVADSDPEGEAREAAEKAAPVLAAIGGRPADRAPGRVAPGRRPPRLGPRPLPRPDPARGVFATLRVADGVPEALERHVARLDRASRALRGEPLAGDAAARILAACAEGPDPGRLRVDLVDGELRLTRSDLPEPGDAVELRGVVLPGGLGAHKWADRRAVDALQAACGDAVALLVDLDGGVLEAVRANVVARVDGRWLTPPDDGRLWAGTVRERLLEAGAVTEAPLALARLPAAEAVVLTGALRGIEPAEALDGAPLARHPAAVAALAAAIGLAPGAPARLP